MAGHDAEMETRLTGVRVALSERRGETERRLEQVRALVERELAGVEALRSKLRALDRMLQHYSREELRQLFETATEREVRLAELRAELDRLESWRALLTEEARALADSRASAGPDACGAPPRPGRDLAGSEASDVARRGAAAEIAAQQTMVDTMRECLAVELHDRVAQPLHHLALQAEVVPRTLKADPGAAAVEITLEFRDGEVVMTLRSTDGDASPELAQIPSATDRPLALLERARRLGGRLEPLGVDDWRLTVAHRVPAVDGTAVPVARA